MSLLNRCPSFIQKNEIHDFPYNSGQILQLSVLKKQVLFQILKTTFSVDYTIRPVCWLRIKKQFNNVMKYIFGRFDLITWVLCLSSVRVRMQHYDFRTFFCVFSGEIY